MGVAVLAFTLASQAGRTRDRPMTHRYRACPSIATISDVRMPRLAPAPITFDTHPQPSRPVNAPENGASGSICTHQKKEENSIGIRLSAEELLTEKRRKLHCCSILEKVGQVVRWGQQQIHPRSQDQRRPKGRTGIRCQGQISTVLLNHSLIDHIFPHTFSVFPPKQPKICSIRKQVGPIYSIIVLDLNFAMGGILKQEAFKVGTDHRSTSY
jgi:hypothetical protein